MPASLFLHPGKDVAALLAKNRKDVIECAS